MLSFCEIMQLAGEVLKYLFHRSRNDDRVQSWRDVKWTKFLPDFKNKCNGIISGNIQTCTIYINSKASSLYAFHAIWLVGVNGLHFKKVQSRIHILEFLYIFFFFFFFFMRPEVMKWSVAILPFWADFENEGMVLKKRKRTGICKLNKNFIRQTSTTTRYPDNTFINRETFAGIKLFRKHVFRNKLICSSVHQIQNIPFSWGTLTSLCNVNPRVPPRHHEKMSL